MRHTIETAQANAVRIGMDRAAVRRLLGEPGQIVSSGDVAVPSAAFAALGSTFRFDDHDLEEVWVYGHEVRTRMKFLFGFRDGQLVQAWRETVSQAVTPDTP